MEQVNYLFSVYILKWYSWEKLYVHIFYLIGEKGDLTLTPYHTRNRLKLLQIIYLSRSRNFISMVGKKHCKIYIYLY